MMNYGYRNVANVGSGFTGKKGPLGGVAEPGWLQLDLPVDCGDGDERSYEFLLARAPKE